MHATQHVINGMCVIDKMCVQQTCNRPCQTLSSCARTGKIQMNRRKRTVQVVNMDALVRGDNRLDKCCVLGIFDWTFGRVEPQRCTPKHSKRLNLAECGSDTMEMRLFPLGKSAADEDC